MTWDAKITMLSFLLFGIVMVIICVRDTIKNRHKTRSKDDDDVPPIIF